MLDIRFIRENADLVRRAAAQKKISVDLDRLLALDQSLRPLQQELEGLQAQRNQLSKTIGATKDAGERERLKGEVAAIKSRMEACEREGASLRDEFQRLMLLVPAPPRADVPIGADDRENQEVRKVGLLPEFGSWVPLDHATLAQRLGWLDVERGVRLAGSRSYVLRGMGAMLEQAVLRYAMDTLVARGFEPMSIPVLVKEEAMVGTGYFPTGREQAYCVEKDELVLVGTAEVSLTSFRAGEILAERELPLRMVAQSPCFRREAGTYGKDTQGLYRVHQFQKIEQVIVGPADAHASEQFHTELLSNAEAILQGLELPYRVVYVCTGDLGQGQVRKHDIETWMPSRKSYAETHSCSTFHDFQARRLQLRYKDSDGTTRHCHTLNNTAIASPRILIPLLECHQEDGGFVRIPKPLRPYLGGAERIGGFLKSS